jgi:KDO2-lipid IV(A) lauroyltransferase
MIKKLFSYLGVALLHLLSYLPFFALYLLADFLYLVIYYLVKYRRKVVRKNLSKSFPEKSLTEVVAIEKQFYRYFTELMVETIKLSSIGERQLKKRVTVKNSEQVEAYFANGESVLAALSHYGNWELCVLGLGLRLSVKPTAIFKPINNKIFEKWFTRFRTKFGNRFIPMRQTAREIIATKNKSTIFFFGSDQSPRVDENQHIIEFLHQRTSVLLGLEKIAKQTNRPVFYFDCIRKKRGYYEIDCTPICLDPKSTQAYEITKLYFDKLNVAIQRDPAFWLWSHNRWKLNG